MKKILIATSALTALTFSSALALEVKTSGVVEYFITSDDTATVGTEVLTSKKIKKVIKKTSGNQKLSQKQAHVKFSAEGMSSGLSYGAYVKVGSGTNTANRKRVDVPMNDKLGDEVVAAGPTTFATATTGALTAKLGAAPVNTKSYLLGYTQMGQGVFYGQKKGGNAATAKIWAEGIKSPYDIEATLATSGLWVSNSMGKIIFNQESSAAENAFMGDVKAARFRPHTLVSDPRGSHRTFHETGMERVTYESPEINGFQVAYTQGFKGNISADKTHQATAPKNHAISYKGEMNGVKFKLAYGAGREAGRMKSEAPKDYTPVAYKAEAPKGNYMGGEVAYGKFTVGYNKFTNKKRYYQKKDTGGSIYGVRYFDTFWAVGYTVVKSEDKNTYAGHYASQGNTKAITGSLWIDKGFNFYFSRAKNTVTYHGLGERADAAAKFAQTGTAKAKQTHSMFGIKATF